MPISYLMVASPINHLIFAKILRMQHLFLMDVAKAKL